MALNRASHVGFSQSQWREKVDFFRDRISPCQLCPRRCGARRLENGQGVCQVEREVRISSFGLHFGEEPPVSGFQGSGTVFFSGCTLRCLFCQNHPISHGYEGQYCTIEELAGIFIYLQKQGAHNINLVSPTPYLFHIVTALELAARKGLTLPVVYNTGGYERDENVHQLEGLMDIYMPDLKYSGSPYGRQMSGRLSKADDYYEQAFPSLLEMIRQAGPLLMDENGVGIRGTIVRHLIIPSHVQNSIEVLEAMAGSSLNKAYLSLMSQYHPAFHACDHPDIARRLKSEEYRQVRDRALNLGFSGWFQEI